MPLRRKIGLCIVLAGSIFSLATCVMRIITAREENLYQTAWGILWASVEQSLVVILGSVPTLPALRKLEFGFLRSFGSSIVSLLDIRSSRRNGYGGMTGNPGSRFDRSKVIGDDMVQLSSREA